MFAIFPSASHALAKFAFSGCAGTVDLMGLGANTTLVDTNIISGPGDVKNGATMFLGTATSHAKIEAKLDTTYSLSIFLNLYAEKPGSVVNYGTDRGVGLYFSSSGELVFRLVKRNTSDVLAEVKTTIDTGKWYHVGGTYDYNTGLAYLFVNGTQRAVSDTPTKDMLETDVSGVYLGAISGVAEHFKGRVSCVQIFDRALEADELEDLKECELSKSF